MKTLKRILILCTICAYSMAGWAVDYTGSPTSFPSPPSGKVTGTTCGLDFDAALVFRFVSGTGGNLDFEIKTTSGNALPVDVELYIKESTSSNIATVLCGNAVSTSTWKKGSATISKGIAVSFTSGTRYYIAQINLTSGSTTVRYYSNIVTVTATTTPTNQAPTTPSNPNPSNGATGVSTNPTFTWSSTDPEGGQVTYKLYIGTIQNSRSLEASGTGTSTSGKTFNLSNGTIYYWNVDSYDNQGKVAVGPVWSFTTSGQSNVNPILNLSSNSIITGNSLTVSGSGFTANNQAYLRFQNGAYDKHSEYVSTNSSGNFSYNLNSTLVGEGTITVTATDVGSGKQVSKSFTVTASGSSGDCTFSDLPNTDAFYTATCFLSKRGVIDGNGSGATHAAENIIRAEIAKASFRGVYSLNNRTAPTSVPSYDFPSVYSDLAISNAQNSYYYLPAKALLYLEYGDGIAPFDRNNTTFKPEGSITRVDALKVLMETFDIKPDLSSTASYSNTEVNNLKNNNPLKFGYIYKAKDLGIIDDINTFRPFDYCTRGETFLMLYRIMTKIEAGNINDPNPSNADYFEPMNITLQNISIGLNTESGVFRYESRESFNLDGVVPLNFNFSYNSYNSDLPDEFFGMYDKGQEKIITYQPLGRGWSHTYHSFVTLINSDGNLSTNSRAIVHWGGGTIHVYKSNGTKFVPESFGIYDDFNISANGVVTITSKSQIEYRFKKHGASHILELETVTDRNGNQLTINYGTGTDGVARISSVSDGNRQLTFEYRPDNNILKRVIDPLGRKIEFQHSLNSKTGQYEILYASHISFSNPNWITTNYAYYSSQINPKADGLLAVIKLPKGNFIQSDYDNNRRLKTIETKDINEVVRSRIDVNVATNYTSSNKSMSSTVKTFYNNGSSSSNYNNSFTFNPNNRPVQITGNLGYQVDAAYNNTTHPTLPTAISTNSSNIQDIQYDNRGNVTQITVKSLTGSATRTVSISYNSDNTVSSVTDPKGNTMNYYYDSKGNLTSTSAPENATTSINVNAKGLPISVTNPSNIVTEYAYNSYGNLQTTTIPSLGIFATINYDAASRVISVLDFLNRTTSFSYDNKDNLLTETDALNRTTNYAYDANDNLTSITNAKGGVTTLTYDNISDWLTSVAFGGATKNYEYNDDGTLKKFTKPDGTQLNSAYDGSGRITSDGVNSYEYDSEHRLWKITKGGKTLQYSYDGFNQVTGVTYDNKTVNYTYDNNGNILTMAYPDNKTVTYTYDNLNRMKTVTDWNNRTITYNYLPDSRMQSVSYPNGMTLTYAYDNAGRQTGKTVKRSDNTVIASYGFTLDNVGNIITENRMEPYTDVSLPNENVSYAYNSANRITQAGNTSFTFDANGNTKTRGNAGYSYDNLDKLTSGDGFNFEYDGLGNIRSNGNRRYWIDIMGIGNVIAETDMSGNPTAYYLHGAGGLEARILPNGTTEYYVSDYRGSVIAMVDASTSANITHKYQYDEFGKITQQQENDANPFRYVGKYGVMYFGDNLYYMRARFYDPSIGRFLSEDPIWSTNLYPYADNNPVLNIDPEGNIYLRSINVDVSIKQINNAMMWIINVGEKIGDIIYYGDITKKVIDISQGIIDVLVKEVAKKYLEVGLELLGNNELSYIYNLYKGSTSALTNKEREEMYKQQSEFRRQGGVQQLGIKLFIFFNN